MISGRPLSRYDREVGLEIARMEFGSIAWWVFVLISLGPIPLAGAMARERNRSSKAWLWTAVAIGPFAPLALLLLGDRHPGPTR